MATKIRLMRLGKIRAPYYRIVVADARTKREGRVIVACDVGQDGATHNCAIQSVQGGAAFGDAALRWVRSARYRPAVHNGVPVAELHHAFNITFKLNNDDE